MTPRVLLVAAPWMTPNVSSIALATLRPALERAGIATDTLYGSVLFPRTATQHTLLERHGHLLFVPELRPEIGVEAVVDRILARHRQDLVDNFGGDELSLADFGIDVAGLRVALRADISRANTCLDRCLESAMSARYDVVGFSITFETQLPAALSLARRLKQRDPDIRIMFGGAACVAEQGEGVLASFPIVDAVCCGEGESVIIPLVRALRGEGRLADVPGIAFRGDDGTVRRSPSPPLIRDLDELPAPRYDDFIAQATASEWSDLALKLFFETSRGCWWGQKHLCTFCGLNGEGLAYRSKSPERAFEEIRDLYRDYPQATLLQATDNILHTRYFDTLLPRLASLPREPERPLRMFFEIKSNLKPGQAALMAAAGFDAVQPGIESFSDEVLRIMDKGCTGLGQIHCIKSLHEEGVSLVYNLLFGSPGETVGAYREMLEMLPSITHLPPPVGVTRLDLMRFSPYYLDPQRHGIENIRPQTYYVDLFGDQADVMRLSYHFDYDHPSHHDRELQASYRAFTRAVNTWIANWQPHRAVFIDRDDHLIIIDHRDGTRRVDTLAGSAAAIYRFLDVPRSHVAVVRAFPHLEPALIAGLVDWMERRRWIVQSSQRVLAVLPRLHEGPREQRVSLPAKPERTHLRVVA